MPIQGGLCWPDNNSMFRRISYNRVNIQGMIVATTLEISSGSPVE
jgi:hypothetical protein